MMELLSDVRESDGKESSKDDIYSHAKTSATSAAFFKTSS